MKRTLSAAGILLVLMLLISCQSLPVSEDTAAVPAAAPVQAADMTVRELVPMTVDNWIGFDMVRIKPADTEGHVLFQSQSNQWNQIMSYQGRLKADFFQIEIKPVMVNTIDKEYPPALQNDRLIFGFSNSGELLPDTGGFLTQIVFMEDGAYLELYVAPGEYQPMTLAEAVKVPTSGPIYFQGERLDTAWKFSLFAENRPASVGYVPFDMIAADAFNHDYLALGVGLSNVAPTSFELAIRK